CGDNCFNCDVNGAGQCNVDECHDKYTLDTATNTCEACASHCLDCSQPNQCDPDKCLLGYVFDAYSCSRDVYKRVLTICDDCLVACAQNCNVCNYNGAGLCDEGQCSRRYAYDPNNSSCVACPDDCEDCSYNTTRSTTECTQCYSSLGVNNGQTCSGCCKDCHSCIYNGAGKCDRGECHVGYTLGPDDTCKECPPNCIECDYNNDKTECTKCYGIFGLKDDDKTCGACPGHCVSCEHVNNRTECTHCEDHYGIKQEDKTCEACDHSCKSCTTSGAGKCDPGKCHDSYALDDDSETCKQCPDHCVRCTYNSTANRTECSQCVTKYTVTANQTCEACSGPLENCDVCSFGERVCVLCSLTYTWNDTMQKCNGETASLLHGGSWLTAHGITVAAVILLIM
ncbi:hypothetical protein NP493_613g02027, partial [Ridgeia piscesae]